MGKYHPKNHPGKIAEKKSFSRLTDQIGCKIRCRVLPLVASCEDRTWPAVRRCKLELDSSDSALDELQVPDMTSQMMDLEQQLLYDSQPMSDAALFHGSLAMSEIRYASRLPACL